MVDETDLPATTPPPGGTSATAFLQLTQSRVPLDRAGEALTVPDASGRVPIVVLPEQPFRIRNEFVIAGVIAIVVGIILEFEAIIRGGLIGVGVVSVFLGVFQSFIVAVPEGARALLLKSGRYDRTVGAGRHIVPPWIVVSHVVTVREIPFEALSTAVPSRDDVRVDIDALLTFTITAPEKFVFAISAPDFDQVCQAAAQDAMRNLVRAKTSVEILDLTGDDTDAVAARIGAAIAPYGVEVQRLVVTSIQPPAEFMASREARRLAAAQRDEQQERHELQERLQADRDALDRQRLAAKRDRIELKAANEARRLEFLEERLRAYPKAMRQDTLDRRLDVAEALAGNTRAMVHVGGGSDVADALIMQTLIDGDESDTPPAARPRTPKPSDPSA